jgi:flavin reductase (DIM6/NTAB) family NADH-FMN oxidoreductase RutF
VLILFLGISIESREYPGQVEIMSMNENELRKVMRNWTSGVSVVTSHYEGIDHGMTVSSFTSVSLKPPLVTISLMNSSRTFELVRHARNFGITILSKDQAEISKVFASQESASEDRFAGIETFKLTTGALMIKNGLANIDCKVSEILDFGTNSLIIGEVIATEIGNKSKPLLYFNQQYHQLQD